MLYPFDLFEGVSKEFHDLGYDGEPEVNQPVQPQPPAPDPFQPSTSPGPVESPPSLSLSAQEF